MSYRTKYIIIETDLGLVPILFSDMGAHSDVARAYPMRRVVGAGFASLQTAKPYENPLYACYGESTSLKIKSRGELDSSIINRYMGLDPGY